jgi:hypothetical protein
MGLAIAVNFINRSNDSDNSEVVFFGARPSNPPLHTLRFHNNTGSTQTFVCFQPPVGATTGLVPAWFAMRVGNGVEVNFSWQEVWDLIWMETGPLAAGIQFSASEIVPASLTANNRIVLTYTDGIFSFADQGPGQAGELQIATQMIPPNTASIGIGMAGSPINMVQAAPYLTTTFQPRINYWVAVADVAQGELMDHSTLSSQAHVVFPPEVMGMTATLTQGVAVGELVWTFQQGLV